MGAPDMGALDMWAPDMGALDMGAPPTGRLAVLALLLALGMAACGGDGAPGDSGEMVVDTLPGGVIHVRNPEGGSWGPGEGWRLEEELRIGTADGQGLDAFGDMISSLALDPLGRIWVADQQSNEVRVFEADGRPVRRVGGTGRGPGEFLMPFRIFPDPAGRMWVADVMNARFTVLDTAGAVLETHRRPHPGGGNRPLWGFDGEGRLLESEIRIVEGGSRESIVRLDATLAPADTFVLPPMGDPRHLRELRVERSVMRIQVPLTPMGVVGVGPDHQLWTGWSDTFRLVQRTLEGDTLRVVERAWTPEPVTAEHRAAALEEVVWYLEAGGELDPGEIPATLPAFRDLLVDHEGRPWVVAATGPRMAPWDRFHLFEADGRYLGEVEVDPPMAPGPVLFGDGVVWATVRDELDVVYLVRYRVRPR
jgi:hypothetical protein